MNLKKLIIVLNVSFLSLIFSGCGVLGLPFILGATGVGVATKIAIDKRSTGAQIDDNTIDSALGSKLANLIPKSNINVTTFNRVVLLTGEVPNASLKELAETTAKSHINVRGVFNYLNIAPNSGIGARASDTLITTKVKTYFIANENTKARDIKVVTEDSVVYLFGILTAAEAEYARDYVANEISGVKKVVTLFEIK